MSCPNPNERAPTPPINYPAKGIFEYLTITAKVMKDKAFYTIWNFDLHESVDRCYPNESYYSSITDLLTQPACHIIDNLYLGSAFNAADYSWLEANDISIIVNATPGISNYYPQDFKYIRYNVTDLGKSSIKPYFDEFYQLVEENPDQKIFVHCFAGRSRSASLVLYYIMRKYGWSLTDTIDYLKTRRQSININTKFIEEIIE